MKLEVEAGRRFLSGRFDAGEPSSVAGATEKLLARPLASGEELRHWLHDWSELASLVSAGHARRAIATHRDTRDAGVSQQLRAFVREVLPVWEEGEDRLNRAYLASPYRGAIGEGYRVFDRRKEVEASLFRPDNTVLQADLRELGSRYTELMGGIMVEWRGERRTPQRCMAELALPERGRREGAWRAVNERYLRERDRIDALFDEQLALRHRMAQNAGYESYRAFRFAEMGRFDYSPEDCTRFHDAAGEVAGPLLRESQEERRRRLDLGQLRPWDLEAELRGTTPEPLFATQEELIDLVRSVLGRVDRRFAAEFELLVGEGMLDLMSREGKAPGGYNCLLEDVRLPFIFFNAVGRPEDLRTLLHEAGHAFHSLAARDLPLIEYRHAPLEFCEVASMSMELFGLERLGEVIDPVRAEAILAAHLGRVLRTLSQVAIVDAFQHWVYDRPGHSREERGAEWLRLNRRFGGIVEAEGLDELRASTWQRIPHLFASPFYYMEYGIAQVGALQMWRNYLADPQGTVETYRGALALGGSRALPRLFEAAGIRFAFDAEMLREVLPLVPARERELR